MKVKPVKAWAVASRGRIKLSSIFQSHSSGVTSKGIHIQIGHEDAILIPVLITPIEKGTKCKK